MTNLVSLLKVASLLLLSITDNSLIDASKKRESASFQVYLMCLGIIDFTFLAITTVLYYIFNHLFFYCHF